ncbi:hypothetical protein, partial [Streptomyces sp. BF23-19]
MNTPAAERTSSDPYPAETVLEQAFADGARADLMGAASTAARTVRAAALTALLRGVRRPGAAAGRDG